MKPVNDEGEGNLDEATLLQRIGRDPGAHGGAVNIPPYRASTYISNTVAEQKAFARRMADPADRILPYGRLGNPTTQALEDAVARLEGGFRSLITPSGLAAISGALLATLRAGDHLLIAASCYWNTRGVADLILDRAGIAVDYYDPHIGADIARHFRENTRAVYVESPGSRGFEI